MTAKTISAALLLTLFTAFPALAGDIMITDSYARAASPSAKSGAAFVVIENHGADDRLTGVSSDVAAKVELHTNEEGEDGVMRMRHVEDGFDLPKHGEIVMQRGGHHVMFMGLKEPFEQGAKIPLTLHFESGKEIELEVDVDFERGASSGHGHSHDQSHDHSEGHSHNHSTSE